jgi:GPH family glycoside/pentoside/hexuronide:cation symporter
MLQWAEMSDDFKERTSIMAIAQWIGQWAWVIAPWFWIVMYDLNGFHLRMLQLEL